MPTEKADIFTLAKFADLDSFKEKFHVDEINVKDKNGSGLLHYSISGSKFDIAHFLITNGIDVNMVNADGAAALHLICEHQNVEIAKDILENNWDINLRDRYGNSAVWKAVFNCKGRNYEMVKLFMGYNADLKTKNNAGRSPIDFAEQVGDSTLLSILKN